MTTAPGRTAQEVFRHHSQAMLAGDLDDIVSDLERSLGRRVVEARRPDPHATPEET